jgi:hypothetical protein
MPHATDCFFQPPETAIFLYAHLFIYFSWIIVVDVTAHKCYTAHMTTNQRHWVPIHASKRITTQLNISISSASGCVQTNYEDDSKIIRNVDTCHAFGYTAGWAWCDTCSLLISYCYGADVTLIVNLCHEFCVINLDGPLFICTKEEQRAVIRSLWAEGVPGAEMHIRISVQYGNSVVSQRMVYEWIERFENGRTSIKHEEGARRRASGSYDGVE